MLNLRHLCTKVSRPKCLQKETCKSNENQRETEQFLNIFPEVVWIRIADHLDDKNDILNLLNSSQFFRNLLHHQRVYFLFEPVFDILTSYIFGKNTAATYSLHRGERESNVKSLILNCRLVCRSWNNAIKRLSQLNLNTNWDIRATALSIQSEVVIIPTVVGKIINNCFNYSRHRKQSLNNFILTFQDCNFGYPNTFLGRSISITIEKNPYVELVDVEEDFWNLITIFLDIFGEHVLHCKVVLTCYDISNETYTKIYDLLNSLPNLQTLHIEDQNTCLDMPILTLRRQPLTWEHLRSVKFRNVCTPLSNAIICDAKKIQALCIQRNPKERRTSRDLSLGGRFENLEELELWDCNWEEIQALSLSKYPLKRLHLELDENESACLKINWTELFEFLSKLFGETLEELVLALPKLPLEARKRFCEESRISRLNMSKLRKINLNVRCDCSFDFLLGLKKSLEWLHICVKNNIISESQKSILQIWTHLDKMNESNVWGLFPKLRTVETSKVEYEWLRRKEVMSYEGGLSKWVKQKSRSKLLSRREVCFNRLLGCVCIPSARTFVRRPPNSIEKIEFQRVPVIYY